MPNMLPSPPDLAWPNTLSPFRMFCQKVLPAVYDDSLSYYELLCKVVKYLNSTMENVNALNEALQQIWAFVLEIYGQLDRIDDLEAEVALLKEQMQALATNALVYDVTMGLYRPSMATSRRAWQAGHYYAMTVEDLASYTVQQAADLNVRHVMVDGRSVYMGEGAAADAIPVQYGYSVPCFVPDDYVKKSDLAYIDSDNLQQRVIMGVLDTDAATDLITPTPYARPYTAYDLNNTWVLYNDHVVTDMDNDCEAGE